MELYTEKRKSEDTDKTLYIIFIFSAGIANMIGTIANLVIYGLSLGTIICGCCAVILILTGILGNVFNKRKTAEIIILFIIEFFEFPFLYYEYGKETITYMVLGIVATAVFMDGLRRQIMLAVEIIADIAVMIVTYIHPGTLEVITEENSIGSTICSFVIVSVCVGLMLTLLLKEYIRQQKRLFELSEELEEMAHLDPLTTLYNRRYLTEYIEGKLNN